MLNNNMEIKFLSLSENETFARAVVSAFCLPLNPSVSDLSDIKTAVSEAVTNAVVHAYPDTPDYIYMTCDIDGDVLHIKIKDKGIGIENLEKALEPFYTTKPDEERSGMGFTVMQTFMDNLNVSSTPNGGTVVSMSKKITSE